jgi:hypothetical protein
LMQPQQQQQQQRQQQHCAPAAAAALQPLQLPAAVCNCLLACCCGLLQRQLGHPPPAQ